MVADLTKVHAVLLLGGGGTRLWPLSTDDYPKQFLPLFQARSLYQMTLARIRASGIASIHVVTNERYCGRAGAQAAEIGIAPAFILESARRDSGPAIAAAVASINATSGPDAVIAVFPCDHLINDHAAFTDALRDAVQTTRTGSLVTFGIQPTAPSVEYGYIERGEALPLMREAFRVAAFCEKPNRETALSYLLSGQHYWNSGIFVFRCGDFKREALLHMPRIWEAVSQAVASGQETPEGLRLDPGVFSDAPAVSIDYALFEKSEAVVVLPRQFAWSDVGNWASVHAALPHDSNGNAVAGNAALYESYNTLAYGAGIRVIALGVHDLAIIASIDGVFVAPKGLAAEIKRLL